MFFLRFPCKLCPPTCFTGSSSRDLSFIVENDDPDNEVTRSEGHGHNEGRSPMSSTTTSSSTSTTTSTDDDLDPVTPSVRSRGQGRNRHFPGHRGHPQYPVHQSDRGRMNHSGRYRFRGHARSRSTRVNWSVGELLMTLMFIAGAIVV